MKIFNNKQLFLLGVILVIACHAMGQPPPPPPPPPPPAAVPLDGGLSLLIAGLLAYGGKLFYNKKNK